jgi:hypothetical protein
MHDPRRLNKESVASEKGGLNDTYRAGSLLDEVTQKEKEYKDEIKIQLLKKESLANSKLKPLNT